MPGAGTPEEQYRESCRREFWQQVFRAEAAYLAERLEGFPEVLSVGCGPADVEGELVRRGFSVTGLDVSREVLDGASDGVRAVVGRAEELPFSPAAFDAVIFIASLQFVDDYRRALAEAWRVLRTGGRLIALLLNPESAFFRAKRADPGSYVNKIRYAGVQGIEAALKASVRTHAEYFLGLAGGKVCQSQDPAVAALYVLSGDKPGGN